MLLYSIMLLKSIYAAAWESMFLVIANCLAGDDVRSDTLSINAKAGDRSWTKGFNWKTSVPSLQFPAEDDPQSCSERNVGKQA